MTSQISPTMMLETPEASTQFARRLALFVDAPATVLLEGPIGAGKSHIARTMLRALGVTDLDIPSPTFTLVQTYDSPAGPIWHADLYRLSSADEAEELGLFEAFETAICLVEWPDRLADEAPNDALLLSLSPRDEGREATLSCASDHAWSKLFESLPA